MRNDTRIHFRVQECDTAYQESSFHARAGGEHTSNGAPGPRGRLCREGSSPLQPRAGQDRSRKADKLENQPLSAPCSLGLRQLGGPAGGSRRLLFNDVRMGRGLVARVEPVLGGGARKTPRVSLRANQGKGWGQCEGRGQQQGEGLRTRASRRGGAGGGGGARKGRS